jgi:hypothetical protein
MKTTTFGNVERFEDESEYLDSSLKQEGEGDYKENNGNLYSISRINNVLKF